MSTTLSFPAVPPRFTRRLLGAMGAFTAEASALFFALLNPRQMLREADRMQALFAEANRVSISDPQRAEALRRVACGHFLR